MTHLNSTLPIVSKNAAAVLEALYRMLPADDEDARYIKLNKHNHPEGCFMPVSVEIIGATPEGQLMAVAHYYEQNGDLVPDPSVTFLRKPASLIESDAEIPSYIPVDYEDSLGQKVAVHFNDDSTVRAYNQRILIDLIRFTSIWMKNIKSQQAVKPVAQKTVHNGATLAGLATKAQEAAKKLGFDNLSHSLAAGKNDEIASIIKL